MKASLIFSLLAMICGWLPAQQFFPVNQGMKWGMINESGELIFPYIFPAHDAVHYVESPFFEGYFVCEKGKETAIYDLSGKYIFSHPYERCNRLADGYWAVGREGKMAIFRPGEDSLQHFSFEYINPLNNSLLEITQNGLRYLARMDGTPCFEKPFLTINAFQNSWIVGTRQDGTDIFDFSGKHILSFQDTFIHELSATHISYKLDNQIRNSQLFGLMNWQKQVLTKPEYVGYNLADNGFIWVMQNNLWGVLNDSSRMIYPPTFGLAGNFGERLAVVQVGNSVGLINKQGDMIAEPKYLRAQVFEDMARLQNEDGTWQQLPFDSLGRPIRRMRLYVAGRAAQQDISAQSAELSKEQQYQQLGWYQKKGYWAWRHPRTGEFVIKGNLREVHPLPEKGISIVVKEFLGKAGQSVLRYGLVDHRRGKWLAPPGFLHIYKEDFEKGNMARVTKSDFTRGIINRRGQVRLFNQVTEIRPFFHGLAIVEFRNDKLAILKKDGTFAKPFVSTGLSEITDFEDGVALFRTQGKWGAVDSLLRIKIPPTYNSLYKLRGTDLYQVSQSTSSFRYYNPQGHFLFEVHAAESGDVHEGKVWLQNEDRSYAFYDTLGREIVPFGLTRVNDFQEGLAAVAKKGHGWGFIDESGNWIMEKYEHAKPFAYGLAPVRQRRRYGYLNKNQQWLIEPCFRAAYCFQAPGLAVVRKRRRYGVIDTLGQRVLNMRFRGLKIEEHEIRAQRGGRKLTFDFAGKRLENSTIDAVDAESAVSVDLLEKHLRLLKVGKIRALSEGIRVCHQQELFGLINSKGEEVVPVEYDQIKTVVSGKTYTLFKHGRQSYVNQNGDWIFNNQ
jgi:hypothetical protein